jgi:hypothetical protein
MIRRAQLSYQARTPANHKNTLCAFASLVPRYFKLIRIHVKHARDNTGRERIYAAAPHKLKPGDVAVPLHQRQTRSGPLNKTRQKHIISYWIGVLFSIITLQIYTYCSLWFCACMIVRLYAPQRKSENPSTCINRTAST